MEKLRYAMVGGGSNFGRMHMRCAAFDHLAVMTAGCFSRDTEKNSSTARRMGVPPDRCYDDYRAMAEAEAQREDGIDFVIISTPNRHHYDMARLFLERGFHIMLDKPMAFTSAQAEELAALAEERGVLLNLTYTFTGFPIVRQMRDMIDRGEIGRVNMVAAEFPQCWLAEEFHTQGEVTAWRAKRDIAGTSCCTADIGIHIECLVRYLTGLRTERVSACLDRFGYGTELEVNSMVMLRYEGGAVGQYFASQVCAGCYSDLKVRIFGDKGTLEWTLKDADKLGFARFGEPRQELAAARPYLCGEARGLSRCGQGFPEGIYGSVANLYTGFCENVLRVKQGAATVQHYPGARDGVISMRYIEAVVESAGNESAWVTL